MLHVNDLTYRIGGRTLFDQATVHIPVGHTTGLVGRNGSGKTTLFRLVFGDLHADGGTLRLRPRASVGGVAQEAPDGDSTLIDWVLAADTERAALSAEAETASDPYRIAEIHTRLADIEAHAAPARAATILSGLGFDEAARQRPLSDFSGGWRMRVALAATLFVRPDLLLLDEPTNHLDLEASLWLESHLARWPGTLIIISHDRNLLNRVVDEIVHLDGAKLTRYSGDYDRFERTRREKLALAAKQRHKQLAQRRHIQDFIDRFRAKATKARQAQSRIKMLERMEPIAAAIGETVTTFDFPKPKPLSPPLVALEDAEVGYGAGPPVLRGLDLRIDMDDRIGLLGANGNGKSTLIKLLAGKLKPQNGKLGKSKKLEIGYFAQHQTDELNPATSAFEHMQHVAPMMTAVKARGHLGAFGFSQAKADTRVADLSGGEKARLLFALMSLGAPQLMLLDEPTNHLDIDTREALVQALNTYDGAVILVSHDPHLLELVCDRLWLVADGTCTPFDGDMADYRRLLLEQRRGEKRDARGPANGNTPKMARRNRAAKRAETASLRATVKAKEKRVEALGKEKETQEHRLADPTLYDGPADAITALQTELTRVTADLEKAEHEWLEAHDALEAAGSPPKL